MVRVLQLTPLFNIMENSSVCVLVSGGIDSLIAYRYAKTLYEVAIPLFVDIGQPYLAKELESVRSQYGSELRIVRADLCTEALDNVPTVDSQEIYGRNLLLAFYGAQLAPTVWLAALETEMGVTAVEDKQPLFFESTTNLFSFLFRKKWPVGVKVTTPFAHHTKSDIVALALAEGLATKDEVTATTSCYDPEHHSCGKCSTCHKRWIALVNNGIEDNWSSHPYYDNQYGLSLAPQIFAAAQEYTNHGKLHSRFSVKRMQETVSAFHLAGITPSDIKQKAS
jgi:7-cyano-7-deazaguanine synthase